VGATRANQRSTAWDFKAAKSRLYPTLDVTGDVGGQYVDQPQGLDPADNAEWRLRRVITGTLTQVLFDGWDRANDIYRSAARVDAAALRVQERSEALGLDAVEAYIDVRRHRAILAIAQRSRKRLQGILGLVRELVSGGKGPASDVDQAIERITAADTVIAQIKQSLEEAKAKYRQVVGREPDELQEVRYPPNLPVSTGIAFNVALANSPAYKAAGADAKAAFFAVEQAKSGYYPTISLEGRASYGHDLEGTPGRNVDVTGKVAMAWNLFNGFGTQYRKTALREQLIRAQLEQEAVARTVRETIDRAFAAYTIGGQRVASAQEQVNATNRVLNEYQNEYKLAKRSLLDLLDAESAYFNSQFQLTSAQAVRLFSTYQLLATMGRLLYTLSVQPPPEAHSNMIEQTDKGFYAIDIEPLRQ
jgi:adhesin transport system outer membrane protein